jgi:hypothetical protein
MRGVYRLTQEGRVDYTDPEETHGLSARSKAAEKAASKPKYDPTQNIAKARAKCQEMRKNGTLVYKKKPGRPRKQQPEQQAAKPTRIVQSREAKQPECPVITIAGQKTKVDSELIDRLLRNAAQIGPMTDNSKQHETKNGEQELVVPFSTDIKLRLRVVVEVV